MGTHLATITLEIFIYRQSAIQSLVLKSFILFWYWGPSKLAVKTGKLVLICEDLRPRGVTSKALTTGRARRLYIPILPPERIVSFLHRSIYTRVLLFWPDFYGRQIGNWDKLRQPDFGRHLINAWIRRPRATK